MLDKIDAWQVFWTILIFLVSYISVMVTFFMKKLNKIEAKVDLKVNLSDCKEIRSKCVVDCRDSRERRDKFIERLNKEAAELCRDIRNDLSKSAHVHGAEGKAGEVIPK